MVKIDENGNGKIQIDLPEEWFEEKEKMDASWREIVGLGIKAKKDNPQLINRIKDIECKFEKILTKQIEAETERKLIIELLNRKIFKDEK